MPYLNGVPQIPTKEIEEESSDKAIGRDIVQRGCSRQCDSSATTLSEHERARRPTEGCTL